MVARTPYSKTFRIDWGDDDRDLPDLVKISPPGVFRHTDSGEMATLAWLRLHTRIPVPKPLRIHLLSNGVETYNVLFMRSTVGTPASRRWEQMSESQRVRFTEQVAEIQAELIVSSKKVGLRAIGTLGSSPRGIAIGRMEAKELLTNRGLCLSTLPFGSSWAWLETVLHAVSSQVASPDPDGNLRPVTLDQRIGKDDITMDLEQRGRILSMATNLRGLAAIICPGLSMHLPERSCLYQDNLSLDNILVDAEGEITGIVDWEFASCLPYWVCTRMPRFLRGLRGEWNPITPPVGGKLP
jgi:hypothetical protein